MSTMYRLSVLLDGAGNPLTASIATLVDEDRVGERVWPFAPFDTPTEVFELLLREVDIQPPLWQDASTSGRRQEGAPSTGGAPSSLPDPGHQRPCMVCEAQRADVPAVTDESGPGDASAP